MPQAPLTLLVSRSARTIWAVQPAWQGVMYSTRASVSQTGLKPSTGQEQGAMQPGNSSALGWVLVKEKAAVLAWLSSPRLAAWGLAHTPWGSVSRQMG